MQPLLEIPYVPLRYLHLEKRRIRKSSHCTIPQKVGITMTNQLPLTPLFFQLRKEVSNPHTRLSSLVIGSIRRRTIIIIISLSDRA